MFCKQERTRGFSLMWSLCGRPHMTTSHRWTVWLALLMFSHVKLVLLKCTLRDDGRELFGGSWTRRWGHPGLVKPSRERDPQRELAQREFVRECVCVPPIICVSSAFCEGTRWGPFTPLWVLEAPCSHFLLSFVTNQVPFSPFSSPPHSILLHLSLPPLYLHLGPPLCTVDFHSFTLVTNGKIFNLMLLLASGDCVYEDFSDLL